MMSFEIQIILSTTYGEFRGKVAIMNEQQYAGLLDIAKNFYTNGGFELTLEDGNFIVVPPDVVQKSILKIEKKIIKDYV